MAAPDAVRIELEKELLLWLDRTDDPWMGREDILVRGAAVDVSAAEGAVQR
jgi:hypothetical protein